MKAAEKIQAGTRKAYSAKGERTQKMMSFRVDLEVWAHLECQPNKGRYINELIRRDMGQ